MLDTLLAATYRQAGIQSLLTTNQSDSCFLASLRASLPGGPAQYREYVGSTFGVVGRLRGEAPRVRRSAEEFGMVSPEIP